MPVAPGEERCAPASGWEPAGCRYRVEFGVEAGELCSEPSAAERTGEVPSSQEEGGFWAGPSGFDRRKTGLSALSSLSCPQQRAAEPLFSPTLSMQNRLGALQKISWRGRGSFAFKSVCLSGAAFVAAWSSPFLQPKTPFPPAVGLGKLKRGVAGCEPLKLGGFLRAASLV